MKKFSLFDTQYVHKIYNKGNQHFHTVLEEIPKNWHYFYKPFNASHCHCKFHENKAVVFVRRKYTHKMKVDKFYV